MKKLFYKIAFWKSWDEEKRANCSRFFGVVFAVFFLFSLIALVSYLFTWKPDKSVLGDPMMTDADVHVSNGGGKLGLKWADFLISDCFGLWCFSPFPPVLSTPGGALPCCGRSWVVCWAHLTCPCSLPLWVSCVMCPQHSAPDLEAVWGLSALLFSRIISDFPWLS